MPFFSIIIPSYNSSKNLKKCLRSIDKQTFSDYEVLIIDNQSTDDTLKVVAPFLKENIKFFSEQDTGIYDAMNKGIEKGQGQWFYFLGADDLLEKGILQKIWLKLNEEGSSAHQILYGYYRKVLNSVHPNEHSPDNLLFKNMCHQAIFYHRSCFEKMGCYNTKYPVCADWLFNIKCFTTSEITHTKVDHVIATVGSNGFSSYQLDHQYLKDMLQIDLQYFRSSHSVEDIYKANAWKKAYWNIQYKSLIKGANSLVKYGLKYGNWTIIWKTVVFYSLKSLKVF